MPTEIIFKNQPREDAQSAVAKFMMSRGGAHLILCQHILLRVHRGHVWACVISFQSVGLKWRRLCLINHRRGFDLACIFYICYLTRQRHDDLINWIRSICCAGYASAILVHANSGKIPIHSLSGLALDFSSDGDICPPYLFPPFSWLMVATCGHMSGHMLASLYCDHMTRPGTTYDLYLLLPPRPSGPHPFHPCGGGGGGAAWQIINRAMQNYRAGRAHRKLEDFCSARHDDLQGYCENLHGKQFAHAHTQTHSGTFMNDICTGSGPIFSHVCQHAECKACRFGSS